MSKSTILYSKSYFKNKTNFNANYISTTFIIFQGTLLIILHLNQSTDTSTNHQHNYCIHLDYIAKIKTAVFLTTSCLLHIVSIIALIVYFPIMNSFSSTPFTFLIICKDLYCPFSLKRNFHLDEL